ncbi:hypothetical protein FQA39_LY03274 [Lamprigera yunnana]|nr:hypothetical protein FQA39_LY03274 [Lamprigera yunnana]
MGKRMYEICLSGRLPETSELLQKDDLVCVKRCIYALQRDGLPPITTHNVIDDWNDSVLNAVRGCNLFNTIYDWVKYYRQARQNALKAVFPDYIDECEQAIGQIKYPRPFSEPSSPTSSRGVTPVASVHGSDDVSDSVVGKGSSKT